MARFSQLSCYVSASAALILGTPAFSQGIGLPEQSVIEAQLSQFGADVPGSIFALQPFRNAQTLTADNGTAYSLTSLNPYVNSWFLLRITPEGGRPRIVHFENADPLTWDISLVDEGGPALLIEGEGDSFACAPWDDGELEEAQGSPLPYAPVCDWTSVCP